MEVGIGVERQRPMAPSAHDGLPTQSIFSKEIPDKWPRRCPLGISMGICLNLEGWDLCGRPGFVSTWSLPPGEAHTSSCFGLDNRHGE